MEALSMNHSGKLGCYLAASNLAESLKLTSIPSSWNPSKGTDKGAGASGFR
jgi:hypothetical protein